MKNIFGEFTKAAVQLQEAGVLGMKWGVSRPGETKSQAAMRIGKKAIVGGLHAKTALGRERLKAVKDKMVKRINSISRKKSNAKAREDAYKSAGLVKVRGAVSGKTYWESLQEGGPGSGRHKEDGGMKMGSAAWQNAVVKRPFPFVNKPSTSKAIRVMKLLKKRIFTALPYSQRGDLGAFRSMTRSMGRMKKVVAKYPGAKMVKGKFAEQQVKEGGPGSGRHKEGGGVSGAKLLSIATRKDKYGQFMARVKSFNPKTAKGEKRANKALGWLEKNAARIAANKSLLGKKFRMSKSAKKKNYGPVYGEQEVQEYGVPGMKWGNKRDTNALVAARVNITPRLRQVAMAREKAHAKKVDYLSGLQKSLAGYHKRMADSYMQKHANMGKVGKRNPVFLKKAQYHQKQIGT